MRAFTVKPLWGFLIGHGIKDVENRHLAPVPPTGTAAVHISAKYSRKDYEADLGCVGKAMADKLRAKLPYGALEEMCGCVIAVVDYAVAETTASPWWDGKSKIIALSNPRWVLPYVPCKGQLGVWTLPDDIAAQVESIVNGGNRR